MGIEIPELKILGTGRPGIEELGFGQVSNVQISGN